MVTPVAPAPVFKEGTLSGAIEKSVNKPEKKTAPKPVKKAVAPKVAEKPAPTKKATKKATPAPAAEKAPAKKAVPAAKPEPTKAGGLNKSRILLLQALAKHGGLTGDALAEKSGVHPSLIGNLVGYRDPEINAREVHRDNLLNHKYVKLEKQDVGGKDKYVYTITAAGKAALEKATK